MISRREFLQATLATSALVGGSFGRAVAQGRLTQDELLGFEGLGNVTLVHVTDIHGQLVPLHFREPSVNIGVGEAKGVVPHITGKAFLEKFALRREIARGLRAHRSGLCRAGRRPTGAWVGSIASPQS